MAARAYMWLRMGQRYIDEVLLSHVRLFRGAVGDKFVFMDDNATCHRTLAVQDFLTARAKLLVETILRQNKNTLIRALTEEWDKLPQQLLDNVVQRFAYYTFSPTPVHHIRTPAWKTVALRSDMRNT
ncbi:hypothetical protein TNCV_2318731 [Trichonephila clavipes]|nr:hypothetical protein TNCV_2318731 [Trichonephila clavipes]